MRVFLADFGLARTSAEGSRLTRTGVPLGTPACMSPEQARGSTTLTASTDVWSVGCVLYELLAGRPAFSGNSPAEVLGRVLTTEPTPLRALRPDVPAGLDAVVRACLDKHASRRYPAGRGLREDLERVCRGERPRGAGRGAGGARAVALVAALALAGLGALAITKVRSLRGGPGPPVAAAGAPSARAAALAERAAAIRRVAPADAARLLGEALAAAPPDPAAAAWRLERGLLLWAGGDLTGARAEWTCVPDDVPEGPRARLCRGLLVLFEERQGPGPDPDDGVLADLAAEEGADARLAHAALAVAGGQWAAARAALAGQSDWLASLVRGMVESRAPDGDRGVAVRELDAGLRNGLPFSWALLNLGVARRALGDARGALADFDAALRLRPRYAMALRNRSQARRDFGDARGALADAEAALALDPDSPEARYHRAQARQALGDRPGASADLDAALERRPDFVEARNARGCLRQAMGDTAGAVEDFDAALRHRPDDAGTLSNRGALHLTLGDTARALADLDAALRLEPGAVGPRVNRAAARGEAGDLDGATADADDALRRDPTNHRAWLLRAMVRRMRRDLAGAASDCEAALAVQPELADAYAELGMIRRALGDAAGAAAAFAAFLRLAPDHPRAAEMRRLLAEAEAGPR